MLNFNYPIRTQLLFTAYYWSVEIPCVLIKFSLHNLCIVLYTVIILNYKHITISKHACIAAVKMKMGKIERTNERNKIRCAIPERTSPWNQTHPIPVHLRQFATKFLLSMQVMVVSKGFAFSWSVIPFTVVVFPESERFRSVSSKFDNRKFYATVRTWK